jgi:transposase
MIFGFYNKHDKTEEIISRRVGFSRLEAAKYFDVHIETIRNCERRKI